MIKCKQPLFRCLESFLVAATIVAGPLHAPLHADEATSPAVQTSTTTVTPPAAGTSTTVSSTTAISTSSVTSNVPAAALPGVMPKTPQSFLNEMTGTVLSVDTDAGVVRITVEGGFNVDFKYDRTTVVTQNGTPFSADALGYNDKVLVRYAGKDLLARQIERSDQAPHPIPATNP